MIESRLNGAGGTRLGATASFAVATPIGLLVLLQGGFFGLAMCACGLISSVVTAVAWLRRSARGRAISLIPLLFCVVTAAYLLSALAKGASLTTLAETGSWASCAGFSLLCAAQTADSRNRTLRCLAWFGVVTAVVAILVFVGLLPLVGGVTVGRLE